ncbi:hypothetical protein [Spiroplasma endosymbiont of Labia minor]|uniref:hypothetical protein n=1 Tax=Spiroplasma endosymbiont of Labia minor TaxID=3066305 RepID=UPI0030D49D54
MMFIVLIPAIIIIAMFYKTTKISFLALLPFGGMTFILNKFNKKYGYKNYEVILRAFLFLFINKKYVIKSKNYSTLNLIPYSKIENNYIKLKNGQYLSFIKVNGNNFFDLEKLKQEYVLEQLWNAYQKLSLGGCIIKINEFKNAKETIMYVDELKHKLKISKMQNKINELEYFSRLYVMDQKQTELIEKNGFKDDTNLTIALYIGFCAPTIDEIVKYEEILLNNLKSIYLKPSKLDAYEKVNVINKLIDIDLEDDSEKNIAEFSDNLDKYFGFDSLEHKPNNLKIDNNRLLKIQSITSYPYEPPIAWMTNLFEIPTNIVLNFQKARANSFKKI